MVEYDLIKNIPIDAVERESAECSLEYYDPDTINAELERIKKFGLLSPPVFILEKNQYKAILGKRSVDCCRILKRDITWGLVLTNNLDEYGFFKFLILLKKEVKGFNVIEKAIAVKKAFDLDLIHKTDDYICSLLDIPRNEIYIHNFLRLAQAPHDVKLLILRGKLHENTVFEIFNFPVDCWPLLYHFFSLLGIGTKKRNEIISMLYAITDGNTKTVESILENEELKKILRLHIDPPQIALRVYDFIKELRYPYISQYKKKFYSKLKELDIDRDFQLRIPRDFEHWEFSISIPFSSQEDLKCNLNKLKEIVDKKAFEELMSMR